MKSKKRRLYAQQQLAEVSRQWRVDLFAQLFITIIVTAFIAGIVLHNWGASWLFYLILGMSAIKNGYHLIRDYRTYLGKRRPLLNAAMNSPD